MKNTIRNLVTASGLSALVAFASAQVLNTAAGAAGAVRAPAITPPPPPPPPAVTANVAAQGAAASAAAVKPPLITPVSANAAGAARGGAAAGIPAGVPNVNAQTQASAQGQAHGVAFNQTVSNQASMSLDSSGTVKAIRGTAFTQRERVNTEVQARLDASAKAVAELEARAESAGEKSRAAFAKALVEVRQREKDVRANLRASTMAAKESSWGEVQSALAQSYGAYAQAVVQAEAAVQGDAAVEPKS